MDTTMSVLMGRILRVFYESCPIPFLIGLGPLRVQDSPFPFLDQIHEALEVVGL